MTDIRYEAELLLDLQKLEKQIEQQRKRIEKTFAKPIELQVDTTKLQSRLNQFKQDLRQVQSVSASVSGNQERNALGQRIGVARPTTTTQTSLTGGVGGRFQPAGGVSGNQGRNALGQQISRLNPSKASDQIKGLNDALAGLFDAQTKAATGTDSLAKSFARNAAEIGVAIVGYNSLATLLDSVALQTVRTITELDRLRGTLRGVTGSQDAASQAFEFNRRLAEETATDFIELSRGYASIISAVEQTDEAIGRVTSLFEATARSARFLGITNQQLQAVLLAERQIASSARLSLEEINQLEEAIPGAGRLAAQALKDIGAIEELGDFRKTVADTFIDTQKFLEAFTDQLNKQSAEGIAAALNTIDAQATLVRNRFTEITSEIGQAASPQIIAGLQLLRDSLSALPAIVSATTEALRILFVTGTVLVIPKFIAGLQALNTTLNLTFATNQVFLQQQRQFAVALNATSNNLALQTIIAKNYQTQLLVTAAATKQASIVTAQYAAILKSIGIAIGALVLFDIWATYRNSTEAARKITKEFGDDLDELEDKLKELGSDTVDFSPFSESLAQAREDFIKEQGLFAKGVNELSKIVALVPNSFRKTPVIGKFIPEFSSFFDNALATKQIEDFKSLNDRIVPEIDRFTEQTRRLVENEETSAEELNAAIQAGQSERQRLLQFINDADPGVAENAKANLKILDQQIDLLKETADAAKNVSIRFGEIQLNQEKALANLDENLNKQLATVKETQTEIAKTQGQNNPEFESAKQREVQIELDAAKERLKILQDSYQQAQQLEDPSATELEANQKNLKDILELRQEIADREITIAKEKTDKIIEEAEREFEEKSKLLELELEKRLLNNAAIENGEQRQLANDEAELDNLKQKIELEKERRDELLKNGDVAFDQNKQLSQQTIESIADRIRQGDLSALSDLSVTAGEQVAAGRSDLNDKILESDTNLAQLQRELIEKTRDIRLKAIEKEFDAEELRIRQTVTNEKELEAALSELSIRRLRSKIALEGDISRNTIELLELEQEQKEKAFQVEQQQIKEIAGLRSEALNTQIEALDTYLDRLKESRDTTRDLFAAVREGLISEQEIVAGDLGEADEIIDRIRELRENPTPTSKIEEELLRRQLEALGFRLNEETKISELLDQQAAIAQQIADVEAEAARLKLEAAEAERQAALETLEIEQKRQELALNRDIISQRIAILETQGQRDEEALRLREAQNSGSKKGVQSANERLALLDQQIQEQQKLLRKTEELQELQQKQQETFKQQFDALEQRQDAAREQERVEEQRRQFASQRRQFESQAEAADTPAERDALRNIGRPSPQVIPISEQLEGLRGSGLEQLVQQIPMLQPSQTQQQFDQLLSPLTNPVGEIRGLMDQVTESLRQIQQQGRQVVPGVSVNGPISIESGSNARQIRDGFARVDEFAEALNSGFAFS